MWCYLIGDFLFRLSEKNIVPKEGNIPGSIRSLKPLMLFNNELCNVHRFMMKYFCAIILFALYFVAALANSSVKPAESNKDMPKKAQSNVINNYYVGPNCKKIEQQLAEIKGEIGALKESKTNGSAGYGLFSEVKQQLAEIKQGIRVLNVSGSGGYGLFSEVKQQLAEIKQEIRALKGNQTGCSRKVYKNCAEVYQSGNKTVSGVYKINPDGLDEFEVFCDQKTAGGGWTVFQKRQDGSVDFYRGWGDYKQGFGKLSGEFWLGLDKIHRLTESGSYKLHVDLEDIHGKTAFAEYSSFAVANETEKYKLSLRGFSGTAGDSLAYHAGLPFTTKDRDNSGSNCAFSYKGAWWYKSCYKSNLNGLYIPGNMNNYKGMNWYHWQNSWFPVKRSEMKIRPKDF